MFKDGEEHKKLRRTFPTEFMVYEQAYAKR